MMNEDEEMFEDSDDDYYFGIDNHQVKAWLVKIPKFLAEKWSTIQEPGVELGRLRIYKNHVKDPSGKLVPKVTFHTTEYELQEGQIPIPKNYNLNITKMTPQNEYVFTENSVGTAVEVFKYY
jgi:transcription initiation factor TFIIF subunit beta